MRLQRCSSRALSIIVVTTVAPLITSCALRGLTERFDPPAVALGPSKVDAISMSEVTATLGLEVHNPSNVELQVRQVRYRLSVHGKSVAEGTQRSGTTLPALATVGVEIPVRLSVSTVNRAAPGAMLTGEIPYELEAWLSVGPLLAGHVVSFAGSSVLRIDLPIGLAQPRETAQSARLKAQGRNPKTSCLAPCAVYFAQNLPCGLKLVA